MSPELFSRCCALCGGSGIFSRTVELPFGRQRPVTDVTIPPLGMPRSGPLVDLDAPREEDGIVATMTLSGAHELQVPVLVLRIVPAHEAEYPGPRLLDRDERPRIRGAVFHGLKPALRVRVVVTHPRAAAGATDPGLIEPGYEGRGRNGGAVVLVQHERGRDVLARTGLFDEVSGPFAGFLRMHLVGDDLP